MWFGESAGECDDWLLVSPQSHSHIIKFSYYHILPLIHILDHNQAKQLENVMLGYLCTHALYKFFYILNWVHRYYNEVTMMRTISYISYIIYDNWLVKKLFERLFDPKLIFKSDINLIWYLFLVIYMSYELWQDTDSDWLVNRSKILDFMDFFEQKRTPNFAKMKGQGSRKKLLWRNHSAKVILLVQIFCAFSLHWCSLWGRRWN